MAIIEIEQCSTREDLRNANILPREGIPNCCAMCSGNKPRRECPVMSSAIQTEVESKRGDWKPGEQTFAG